jgi:hypothetical protein
MSVTAAESAEYVSQVPQAQLWDRQSALSNVGNSLQIRSTNPLSGSRLIFGYEGPHLLQVYAFSEIGECAVAR